MFGRGEGSELLKISQNFMLCIFMHQVTIVDAYLKGGVKCNVWKKQKGECPDS